MNLNLVLFNRTDVTVVTAKNAARFLARLVTSDVTKLAVGGVERTAMLNATGGVIDTLWVARTDLDTYQLILAGDNADAGEAWIRQVRIAFDAEIDTVKTSGMYYVGDMAVNGLDIAPGKCQIMQGIGFYSLNWISLVTGSEEQLSALRTNLIAQGAKAGEQPGYEALRILAREPEIGLELDESSNPLETGLEDALDFSNSDRIFIGRALTEAMANAAQHDRLHLVAFESGFDPEILTEVPLIVIGENGYQLTSIARIPEIPLTVGLVRLPHSVEIGQQVECIVKTDPKVYCNKATVVDPQI